MNGSPTALDATRELVQGVAAWMIAETSHTGVTSAVALQRLRTGPTDLGIVGEKITAEGVIALMHYAAGR